MSGSARRKREPAVAVAMVAGGSTITEAARAAGLNEKTVRRWLKQDRFRQKVSQAGVEILRQCTGRLVEYSVRAAQRLIELAEGDDVPPAVQLGACRTIIENSTKLREASELADRLTVQENEIASQKREPAHEW